MSASVLCVISCVSLKVHPGWITIFYSDQLIIITNNICHTEFNKVLNTDVLPYVADFSSSRPLDYTCCAVRAELDHCWRSRLSCRYTSCATHGINVWVPEVDEPMCGSGRSLLYLLCSFVPHVWIYWGNWRPHVCLSRMWPSWCHGCDHRSVTGVTIICVWLWSVTLSICLTGF